MEVPYGEGEFVAHTESDVYGPGKVIGIEGTWRRVRFTRFVASVDARNLRTATDDERAEIVEWLNAKRRQYGGTW
ncbi:hypothetical protein OG897_04360 [Streptomyces sp. NBC_00237]|uniref:hypothetical protein n=1 Tax=Streptomyces sp. NBC_00237 TaxID=2975687 RepID=UPI002251BC8D|nr:hypothetical protein [Streptomyces sp. NBC_00237]MCX5200698.1 hypothetical protein [Streptomyces sp. NBC_00237]